MQAAALPAAGLPNERHRIGYDVLPIDGDLDIAGAPAIETGDVHGKASRIVQSVELRVARKAETVPEGFHDAEIPSSLNAE